MNALLIFHYHCQFPVLTGLYQQILNACPLFLQNTTEYLSGDHMSLQEIKKKEEEEMKVNGRGV